MSVRIASCDFVVHVASYSYTNNRVILTLVMVTSATSSKTCFSVLNYHIAVIMIKNSGSTITRVVKQQELGKKSY